MVNTERRLTFTLNGTQYTHADPQPTFAPGTVRRFTNKEEPQVIAQIPLQDGGTIEIHGYATHYTQEWVGIVWNDDRIIHHDCWVRAADVRRAGEGEWRGKYVQF